MNTEDRPLLIIAGPTAVGKTSLSVRVAKKLNAEIISADSMQVYRHMDIGSAKVTPEEMQGVPHHLIDCYDPEEEFHVVEFQQAAKAAMQDIWSRGKLPVIAGGTGFYVQALLRDIDFTETGGDPEYRSCLEKRALSEGPQTLHAELRLVDPESAEAIHENNVRKVIRALEYYHYTGQRISEHNREEQQRKSPYHFLYIVLNRERSELYRRIDLRVDRMLSAGLVGEVRSLKAMGCHREMVSMQGLGYKEILDYLDGEISLEEAVYRIKRDTRRFAKRQLTWFHREKDVTWVNWEDYDNSEDRILEHILKLCLAQGIVRQEDING